MLLLLLLLGPVGGMAAHWAHSTDLDPNFSVFWTPGENDITFEVQVRTLGYVGFGFSQDGNMPQADLVIGWVYKGQAYFQDRHASGHEEPEIDQSQDYELLLGYENGTHTVLRFRRPYDTCDPHDFRITNDTMRMLFAYHSDEPAGASGPLPSHGTDHRGSRSVYLLERSGLEQPASPDLLIWDLRNPDVTLPAREDTLYWCKIFRLPNLRRKHHMVRYEPLLQPGSRQYMQHVIVYECEGNGSELESQVTEGGQVCYQANMPGLFFSCNNVVVAWAIGSEGFIFPSEVGYPFDPDIGPKYYMMETHYSIPDQDTDITDSSGIRLFYTPNLRRYDAGILSVGLDPNWRHIIPPEQPNVVSEGHCISQCTRHTLPSQGISLFAVLLHTHLIGRKVRLRQIRDGEELPPVTADNNYDFSYQEYRRLQKPAKVLPGDHLIAECVYNSEGRSTITLGGLTTREEMCLVYVLYFPRIELALCHSLPSLPTVLHSLGIRELWQGSSPVMIKSPPELADMTLENRLVSYDWEKNFQSFQETTHRGSFKPLCWMKKHTLLPGTEDFEAFYPNISRPYKEPSSCHSGRWKKPRRRKKPGDDGLDGGDRDRDGEGQSQNILDVESEDRTKVYSSFGVHESSRLNTAPGNVKAGRLAIALILPVVILFWS